MSTEEPDNKIDDIKSNDHSTRKLVSEVKKCQNRSLTASMIKSRNILKAITSLLE